MYDSMLTTVDNPFNPFKQFDDWFRFDEDRGYHTCSYLARVGKIGADLDDVLIDEVIESAIDEICEYNLLGIYKKVTEEDYKNNKWIPKQIRIDEKDIETDKNDTETDGEATSE